MESTAVRFGPGVGVSLGGAGPTWFEGDVPRATRTARVTLVARERGLSLPVCLRMSARAGDGSNSLRSSRARGPLAFFRYLSQNRFVVNDSENDCLRRLLVKLKRKQL